MPYCTNCGTEVSQNMVYCPNCGEALVVQAEPVEVEPVDYSPKSEIFEYKERLNWFQRHLNWVTFFSLVAFYPLAFIIGYLIASIYPYMSTTSYYVISYIILGIWLFGINGWVLRRKNRSLGFLLLFIIPFGWIAFFFVENKTHDLRRNMV